MTIVEFDITKSNFSQKTIYIFNELLESNVIDLMGMTYYLKNYSIKFNRTHLHGKDDININTDIITYIYNLFENNREIISGFIIENVKNRI